MRLVLTILIVFLLINFSNGQGAPVIKDDAETKRIESNLRAKDDSVQHITRLALSPVSDTMKLAKSDTLKLQLDSLKTEISQNGSKATLFIDSLQRIINTPAEKINQGIAAAQSKVDSHLDKLNKPQAELDEEINAAGAPLRNDLNDINVTLQNKTQGVESDVRKNTGKATDNGIKLPESNLSLSTPGMKLPGEGHKADPTQVRLNETDMDLPGSEKLKIPESKLDSKELSEKVDLDLPKLDQLNKVSGEIGEIDSKLDNVQKYEGELKNIKENGINDAEKLPEEIENQVGDVDEIKSLNSEAKKVTEYQDAIQRYKDKKLIQQEIKRKVQAVATDKLNKLTPAFKDAQQQIAKAKKINPIVESLKDIVKKRANEMKGKPFRYRFVPGITLQARNKEKFSIDIAAQAGYKISGRLTGGIGYTYRASISEDNTNILGDAGIHGYRMYMQFNFLKSIYLHGEFESLTIDRLKQPKLFETGSNQVNGSYFGLGKKYNVSRKVKGSVSGLYRVDYKGEVPGAGKVTLRLGFDFSLKKDKKKLLVPRRN